MTTTPRSEPSTSNETELTERSLPVLPVRDTVLFPHAVLPLTVGRESSVQLINSLGEDKTIIVVAQREARVDNPQPTDLFAVGTLAVVHKVVKMPNQSLFVFAEGLERVRLTEFTQLTPFMRAQTETVPETVPPKDSEIEALQRNVLTLFQQIVAGSPTLSDELSTVAMNIEEPGRLVDFIASSLPSLSTTDKQDTLETTDVRARLEKINQHLAKELEVQQLRNKIQNEVQDKVQQTQRCSSTWRYGWLISKITPTRAEPAPFTATTCSRPSTMRGPFSGCGLWPTIGVTVQPILFTHHRHVADIAGPI